MKGITAILMILGLAFTLALTGCPDDTDTAPDAPDAPDAPEAAAEAEAEAAEPAGEMTLVGNWVGDVDSMKEMNPELEEDPMAEMMFGMLSSMKIEFTDDEMIIEAMGQEQTAQYEVVSRDGNKMVIKATDGQEAGEETTVEFIADGRVQLSDVDSDDPPMVIKRAE